MEKSSLFLEVNSDCNAAGSASWAFNGAHVSATVYGPKEANMANELTHRAAIEVSVLPISGMHTPYEGEMEHYIVRFLERLIDVKEYPRCQLIVRLQVISGFPGSSVTMAACVNAISLALIQTSIPLKASVVAVCTCEANYDFRPLMIALDVSHPRISLGPETKRKKGGGDRSSQFPGIFAVYTGVPQPSKSSETSAFISQEKLVAITSLADGDKTDMLCSRARDLFEAMITQISSTQA